MNCECYAHGRNTATLFYIQRFQNIVSDKLLWWLVWDFFTNLATSINSFTLFQIHETFIICAIRFMYSVPKGVKNH